MEGRVGELVTAEEPDGLLIPIAARETLWGRLEFAVYVAANAERRRRVAVVGRAGTTIIDDIAQLDEFDREPWTSGQLSGRITFEPLRQSAGRRAMLRDDEVYPVFHDAVQSVEHVLTAAIERVREEVDAATTARVSDALRQVFGRVLKELADLENPMRTLLGDGPGDDGAGRADVAPDPAAATPVALRARTIDDVPGLDDLEPSPPAPRPEETTPRRAAPARPHAPPPIGEPRS